MSAPLIEHTPSAYDYPLLIKHSALLANMWGASKAVMFTRNKIHPSTKSMSHP